MVMFQKYGHCTENIIIALNVVDGKIQKGTTKGFKCVEIAKLCS